jgi:hypothetical protein
MAGACVVCCSVLAGPFGTPPAMHGCCEPGEQLCEAIHRRSYRQNPLKEISR